jgi:hypothetical protein
MEVLVVVWLLVEGGDAPNKVRMLGLSACMWLVIGLIACGFESMKQAADLE